MGFKVQPSLRETSPRPAVMGTSVFPQLRASPWLFSYPTPSWGPAHWKGLLEFLLTLVLRSGHGAQLQLRPGLLVLHSLGELWSVV